jgi:hypothetical protein
MIKINLFSLKMEDNSNGFDHINKFKELVYRLMNVRGNIKDEESVLPFLDS